MLYTVEAIVIRSIDYGEGNKIITLYARETGKIAVIARGAKKLNSRHSAASQLFTRGLYTYYLSRSGQMGNLNSAEIIHAHHKLREDLLMTAHASYIAEMTDRMVGDFDGSSFLFEQLTSALAAIEDNKDFEIVTNIYEMRILELSGYAPILDRCASCAISTSEVIPGASWKFSAAMGGFLCPNCYAADLRALPVSDPARKLLALFQRLDLRNLGNIDVKDTNKRQIAACLRAYMDHHLGVDWKSRRFLDQLDKFKKI